MSRTPTHARFACVTLVALLAVGTACGDGATATNSPTLQSIGEFKITIGTGTTPQFSWAGGTADGILVAPASGNTVNLQTAMWDVFDDPIVPGAAKLSSPITYGSFPAGTNYVVQSKPQPLLKGQRYLVTVLRSDGASAVQEFIP